MTPDPATPGPDALGARERLPDALRVLVEELPREGWAAHPGFSELIRFWLDRHMMFRQLLALLHADAEAAEAGRLDAEGFARRLSHRGGLFVNELHAHHGIEDARYFPVLRARDPRVERGFAILDRDHHALDGALGLFAERANAVLRGAREREGARDRAGAFLREVEGFAPLLERHLVDEEELVVPVLLRHAPAGLV